MGYPLNQTSFYLCHSAPVTCWLAPPLFCSIVIDGTVASTSDVLLRGLNSGTGILQSDSGMGSTTVNTGHRAIG